MWIDRNFLYWLCKIHCFFLSGGHIYGQSWPAGGRAAGMANAALCNVDIYAAFNNPGALGFLKRSAIGLWYDNRFLLPDLSSAGISTAYASRSLGVFNLAFSRFGGRLFNRNKASFCYARSFSPYVSAAMQFHYHYVAFADMYGHAHGFSADLGIVTKPIHDLMLAFLVNNPIPQRIASFDNERLPTVIRFGLSYLWGGKLRSNTEIEKDLDRPFSGRLGLEYLPLKQLQIRGGIGTGPVIAAFGIGLSIGILQLDLASVYHQVLGFSPNAGISVQFGPEVKSKKSKEP